MAEINLRTASSSAPPKQFMVVQTELDVGKASKLACFPYNQLVELKVNQLVRMMLVQVDG